MKNYLAKQFYRAAIFPAIFVTLLWLFFAIGQSSPAAYIRLGILPRDSRGLPGIITSIFVHGDLGHIASNSLPLFVLGAMLVNFYRPIALSAFLWIWLISGAWLWIGGGNPPGRESWHIGASTLIYGLAAFLFMSGVLRRHRQLMVVSALVVFLYGSIMWGVFPLQPGMSWEGHLFGFIAGILVAISYRREGPQRRVYEWENEPDDDEPGNDGTDEERPENSKDPGHFTITYTIVKKSGSSQ